MGTSKDNSNAEALKRAMATSKVQAAEKAGLSDKVKAVGWKNMTAAECGKIGGLMGGKLGGQMVKRMLARAGQGASQDDEAK